MKQLDKTKAYDLSNLNYEELRQVAKYVFKNKSINQSTLCSINDTINWFIKNEGKLLNHDKELWCFSYTDFNKVDAKELFEEWVPKQGERVLVSMNKKHWEERIFVIKHEEYYYCEITNDCNYLFRWKYMKPYEDEIKVGDWINSRNKIFQYTEGMKVGNKWEKITSPQLIDLLNKQYCWTKN